MRGRRALAALVVAALAALSAGCGVPVSQSPTALGHLPPGLANASTTTTIPQGGQPASVYFVSSGNPQTMLPVARTVPLKAGLDTVLAYLLQGPSQVEATNGVTTALTPEVQVLSAPWGRSGPAVTLATINLNAAFGQISGPEQVLAVSQLVYTTAAFLSASPVPLPTVQVEFEINQQPIAVPLASGAFVSRPVTVVDYASLAPVT